MTLPKARLAKPILPWEGLKGLCLTREEGTWKIHDERMRKEGRRRGQFMSVHMEFHLQGRQEYRLCSYAALTPDGIEIHCGEEDKPAGVFSEVHDAWLAMVRGAANETDSEQAALLLSLASRTKKAMEGANKIISRDDVYRHFSHWRQNLATFANGMTIGRMPFPSRPSSDKYMPNLLLRNGNIFGFVTTGKDKPYRVVYRNNSLFRECDSEADAIKGLLDLYYEMGNDSGHQKMIDYARMAPLLASDGDFKTRFDFPAILNPLWDWAEPASGESA